ncbi:MAG: AAA family ATPase [Terriglobales bacterium]
MVQSEQKSGGGAATQGGINYQNRVAAWVCVHMMAERPSTPVGPVGAPVSIRFESAEPVDDLLVATADSSHSFGQAKRTISLSTTADSDLASVIDQFVRQYLSARNASGPRPWSRPLDPIRDRLVLVTSPTSPATVRLDLAAVLDRARGLTPGQPLSDAAVNQAQQEALGVLEIHVRRSWQSAAGVAPNDADVLAVAKLSYVVVMDVELNGSDEREALNLLALSVVDSEQAGAAWSEILRVIADLSQRRSGTDAAAMRAALQAAGVRLRAAPGFEDDIAKLKSHSAAIITYLAQQSRISVGGVQIHIRRDVVQHLRVAAEANPTVVVGVPGAGKSGVLHDFAEVLTSEGRDVLCIAVDQIAANSLGELRDELGLQHEVLDVLLNWPGAGTGFLVIDALDASRGDRTGNALLALMRQVMNANGRWNVVASIRKYDLRYNPELKELFRRELHEPVNTDFGDPEFFAERHVNVPLFSDAELAAIRRQSAQLDQLLSNAPGELDDLLRVPFNLRLMADIVGTGVAVSELRPIRTQSELLRRYWMHRVVGTTGGNLRERVLVQACRRMIQARRLTTDRQSVLEPGLSEALEQLLSGQALMEWQTAASATPSRQTLAFGHHILFDYAAAQLYLPSNSHDAVALLSADPDLFVMIRPSIAMKFEQLWREDRNGFWDLLFRLCAVEQIPAFGKVVGTTVVADLARTIDDLEPLTKALRSTDQDQRATAETLFRHVVGALTAAAGSAIAGTSAGPWAELLEGVTRE